MSANVLISRLYACCVIISNANDAYSVNIITINTIISKTYCQLHGKQNHTSMNLLPNKTNVIIVHMHGRNTNCLVSKLIDDV